MNQVKQLIYKHRLLFLQLYWLIYLPWFAYVEKKVTTQFHVVHMSLDDHIPFLPVFVVPYLLWFGYVAVAFIHTYLHDKQEYLRTCVYLFIGMTVFLVVSTVYPNGHYMRSDVYLGPGIFDSMIKSLWAADTATNLFPSIHVFNSIGAHLALVRSEGTRDNRFIKNTSFVLMCSIILSTMFIKQHSVFDVMTALLMALILYPVAYGNTFENAAARIRMRTEMRRRRRQYKNVRW